jgi:hypothetical protein
MKSFILLIGILCLPFNLGIAQVVEINGGFVSETWNQGKTYRVLNNVTIAAGTSLTIEPGTKVEFAGGKRMDVYGTIIAAGLPENRITLSSIGPAGERWEGIQFFPNSSAGALAFCDFQNFGSSGSNNASALYFNTNEIAAISNCSFSDGKNGGILIRNFGNLTNLTIDGCVFQNVSGSAITISSGNIKESITLTNNMIDGNGSDGCAGLNINSVNCAVIESENNVYKNLKNSTGGSAEPPVWAIKVNGGGNILKYNSTNDSVVDCSSAGGTKLCDIAVDDIIDLKSVGIKNSSTYLDLLSLSSSECTITGGTMVDNQITGNGSVIRYTPTSSGKDVILSNMEFSRNATDLGTSLSIASSKNPIGKINLSGCQWKDNTGENGGCIKIDAVDIDSVRLDRDTITNYQAAAGGWLRVNTSGKISNFAITGNTFNGSCKSSGDGGLFSLNSKSMVSLNLSGNFFNGKFLSGNGGIVSISANSLDSLMYKKNVHKGDIMVTGNGGAIFINKTIIKEIIIDSNQFNSTISAGGSGGLIYFDLPIAGINQFKFENNTGSGSFSSVGSGGAVFLTARSVNYLIINNNKGGYIFDAKGSGGFFYGQVSGLLNSVLIQNNTFDSCLATGSGGYLYLKSQNLTSLAVLSNTCNGLCSSLTGNGGFIYADGKYPKAGQLTVFRNILNSSSAPGGSGGAFYITGQLPQTISFKENTIHGIASAKFCGGAFFIGDQRLNSKINLDFESNKGLSEVKAESTGGMLYFSGNGLGTVNLNNNEAKTASSGMEGGMFSIFSNGAIENLSIIGSKVYSASSAGTHGGLIAVRAKLYNKFVLSGSKINKTSSVKDGGLLYMLGDLPGGFEMNENKIGKSAAGGSGGALFIDGKVDTKISIFKNEVLQSSAALAGGLFSIVNRSMMPLAALSFQENAMVGAKSGNNGGIGYYVGVGINNLEIKKNTLNGLFESVADGGGFAFDCHQSVKNIQIIENKCSGFKSGQHGGLVGILTPVVGSLVFNGNTVKGDPSTFSATGGGTICLEGVKTIGDILISGNKIDDVRVENNGGFLSFPEPKIIPKLTVEHNSFTGLSADKNGGVIYLNAQECDSLVFQKNTYQECKAGGNGGVLFLTGGIVGILTPAIGSLVFNDNTIKGDSLTFSATGGGTISLEGVKTIGDILISGNEIVDVRAENNGGFLSFPEEILIPKLTVDHNKFTGLFAGKNGGVIYLNAEKCDSLVFQNNTYQACKAGGNGGVLFLTGGVAITSLLDETVNTCTATGSGGYIYYNGNQDFENLVEIRKIKVSDTSGKAKTGTGQAGSFINLKRISITEAECDGLSVTEKGGGFSISNCGEIALNACKFENCSSDGPLDGRGGAVFLENNTYSRINNCSFYYNSCIKGSLYSINIDKSQFITIEFCRFRYNKATLYGAGAFIEGGMCRFNQVGFNNNISKQKPYVPGSKGGAIYLSDVMTKIINCRIFQNASDKGGGIFATSSGNHSIEISGYTYINNNTAQYQGGGVFLDSYNGSMVQSHLGYNETISPVDDLGAGLVLYHSGQNFRFQNCLIYRNNNRNTTSPGAGIHFKEWSYAPTGSTISFLNCTIWGHSQYGVYSVNALNSTKINITNTILFGNDGYDESRQQVNFDNTVFSLNFSDIENLPVALDNNGNMNNYPSFISTEDLMLESISPCIDKGTKDTIMNDHYRPSGLRTLRNDIGATGGPLNARSTGFYQISPIMDFVALFDSISGDASGNVDFKIADFVPEFKYTLKIDGNPGLPILKELFSHNFAPGIHILTLSVSYYSDNLGSYPLSIFIKGASSVSLPEIMCLQGISPDSIVEFPNSGDSNNHQFSFEISNIGVADSSKARWSVHCQAPVVIESNSNKSLDFNLSSRELMNLDTVLVEYKYQDELGNRTIGFKFYTKWINSNGIATDQLLNTGLAVYPTPFQKQLYLKLPDDFESGAILTLFSITGAVLLIKEISDKPGSIVSIDFEYLKPGPYILQLKSQTRVQTTRILKN